MFSYCMALESWTLSWFMAVPKYGVEATRLDLNVYTSEAEIAEENSKTMENVCLVLTHLL